MIDSVAALIAEGKQQHSNNKLAEASRLYRQALADDAGNSEASHLLGLVHFQQGELEEAESLIRSAIKGDDNSCRLQCNLGAVLMAEQRYPEARASFQSALDLDGGDADARYNLALAEQALGRHQQAIDHYRRVLVQQPDSFDVQLNLGTACRDAGRLDEAEALFTQLLDKAPEMTALHFNLGLTLKQARAWPRAVAAFRRCLAADAESNDALFALATTLVESGDASAAAAEYASLREALPDLPRLHFTFGTVLLDLGEVDTAVQALESALAADGDDRDARYALGLAELRRGHAAEALQAFERNLQQRPAASRELAHKMIALAMLGRNEQLGALADTARLVAVQHPQEPSVPAANSRYCESLAAFICNHPALQAGKPGTAGENVSALHALLDSANSEPVAALIGLLEAAVDEYLQDHPRDTEHPTLAQRPPRKQLRAWGQVLSGGGRLWPHLHERAWLSGIYYLKVPDTIRKDDDSRAGWLEIGRPDPAFDLDTAPASRWLCPQAGMLVLFPSWMYQQSLPVPGPQPCISVAFEVLALDSPAHVPSA